MDGSKVLKIEYWKNRDSVSWPKINIYIYSSHLDFFINIDGVIVHPSPTVCNFGVLFDSALCFEPHSNQLVKSCFYQLHNIVHLRQSLNFKDAKTVIHAFITSCLDYCNCLLYGLPNKALNRLQLIQKAAACAFTFTSSWCELKISSHHSCLTEITLTPLYLLYSV